MRLMEHFGISGLTDTLKFTINDEVFDKVPPINGIIKKHTLSNIFLIY